MAFKVVNSLDADITYALGKRNKQTGKTDPETAEGYYLGSRTTDTGKFGPSKLHFLKTPKGNVGVWGKTDMDKKLSDVIPGTMIRISTNGSRETKFGIQHLFKVEVDNDNVLEGYVGPLQSEPVPYDNDDANSEVDDTEDDSQNATLALAEQQASAARVQALLDKNRKTARK